MDKELKEKARAMLVTAKRVAALVEETYNLVEDLEGLEPGSPKYDKICYDAFEKATLARAYARTL